jgi:hypothetical protein
MSRSKTVTFAGRHGQVTLTMARSYGFLPLVGNVPSGGFIQHSNDPYVISWHQTIAGQRTYVAEGLRPSGSLISMQINSTPALKTLDRRMATSWQYPTLMTSTEAVAHLLRTPATNQDTTTGSASLTSRILQRERHGQAWLLVSSSPLTTMSAWEPWDLFTTDNGGKTWHLIRYACSGEIGTVCSSQGNRHFMGQATPAAMRFVSPEVGVIAQADRISPILHVYRTTDGGQQWTEHNFPIPQLSTAVSPTITETASGTMTLTILVPGQTTPVKYRSSNRGRTWSVVRGFTPN